MDAHAVEVIVRRRFGLESAPTLAARTIARVPIAFTRMCSSQPIHERSGHVPSEEAFTLQVMLRPLPCWDATLNHGQQRLPATRTGDAVLFDLADNPRVAFRAPFDMMRCYIPQSAIDSLSYESGLPRVGGLRPLRTGMADPVLHGLALSLAGAMERPHEAQALFVEHAALAFHAHVVHAYGGGPSPAAYRGGLSPRQLQRACEAMLARLSDSPAIGTLARECGLSSSHFARAFRRSTGLAPHQWLMRKRVERARELLAQTEMGLPEIALECGFADQSHFTRIFTRMEKQPPARWRRGVTR